MYLNYNPSCACESVTGPSGVTVTSTIYKREVHINKQSISTHMTGQTLIQKYNVILGVISMFQL